MWEISSHEKPFHDIVHDKYLALRILKGLRPESTDDTPQFYRDLMQKCWHSDPTERPTTQEIFDLAKVWHFSPTKEIEDQFNNANEIRKKNMEIKKETKKSHLGAIYTSRLLTNITKGKKLY